MTDATILAGDLYATDEPRVVAGLLLPYGVVGSTNLGRFSVDKGVFEIPADVSHLNANLEHQLSEPRARFLSASETDAGIMATFKIAETPEGDELLASIDAGKIAGEPMSLSAEVKGVMIKAGKAIAGALTGAAFVRRGAFPGAQLLAAAVDTVPADPNAAPAAPVNPADVMPVDPQHAVVSAVTDVTADVNADGTVIVTQTISTEIPTTQATPTTTPQGDPIMTATATPAAAVPGVLAATASASDEKLLKAAAADVFDAMTAVMSASDMTGEAGQLLAALNDIKISGTGSLPIGGTAVQPNWLGELATQVAYQRRYMPLIKNGSITALEEKGFTIAAGSEPIQAWNGNKSAVPSTTGTTSPVTGVFQAWGVGVDIAREFYDIAAGRPVIEAFVRLLVNSYYRVSDYWTLEKLVAGAGTAIAAETYPTEYPAALGKIIQAIDAVDDTDQTVTSVVVSSDVWKQLRYTPKNLIPEYVTFNLNRVDGTADGTVSVVKDKAGKLATGQVLAIARDAAHVNELAGGPIQLDALDIAKGGIDKAVIGYTQYMTEAPAGLKLIGAAS